jgi:hypothetical protein
MKIFGICVVEDKIYDGQIFKQKLLQVPELMGER